MRWLLRICVSTLRDLFAGVGLCESTLDRKVREAKSAFRSAIRSSDMDDQK